MVVTGQENTPGRGTFSEVWKRLDALRSQGVLIRSLRANKVNLTDPWEQPASIQVRLWRLQ